MWADEPAAPLRSVLVALAKLEVPVGVLLSCGRSKEQTNCFTTCETVLGRSLAARVSIPNEIENTANMNDRLNDFGSALGKHKVIDVA
ncbi:hypothetical protein [Tateyamaria omphalii]|uniref:hypothetical protein n=1 Tax=Tateyamaria omphalii TaxID=299262 RepID=UPI0015601BE4|nr:hypothetical protein [Tateyamaria omphalii]